MFPLLLLSLLVYTAGSFNTAVGNISQYICNIDRVPSLSMKDFIFNYMDKKPVIVQHSTDNSLFTDMSSLSSLYTVYGQRIITLASSNTYSNEKIKTTMQHYLDTMMTPVDLSNEANSTWYFFGDYTDSEWADLLQHYILPPWSSLLNPRLSFGIGPHNSGVPFHFHGPGFSEVFHGKKRWFLYPKDIYPKFDPAKTTLIWLNEVYPTLPAEEMPYECAITQGEVLYFPGHWYHATLNVGKTAFISTFTDERELPKNMHKIEL